MGEQIKTFQTFYSNRIFFERRRNKKEERKSDPNEKEDCDLKVSIEKA
jgi:hypothetical protein